MKGGKGERERERRDVDEERERERRNVDEEREREE